MAGSAAVYLFVNQSNLPTAEQNTVAQAEGPLPPPARLPTLAQAAGQQTAPAATPAAQQDAQPSQASADWWVGEWGNGDEGVITIAAITPGNYKLELQWNPETIGAGTGTVSGNRLTFVAEGQRGSMTAISPDQVMTDNLIGSEACLKVEASGEVFCR